MPVIVMHGSGNNCSLSSKATEPSSHICISLTALILNPLFGLVAVVFACWSMKTASMDWDGARLRGRIALWLAVIGIAITVIAAFVFVLIVFSKDST